MARDVKAYDYKQHEADFIESGVRARLIGSAYVQTGFGDALTFYLRCRMVRRGCAKPVTPITRLILVGLRFSPNRLLIRKARLSLR